MDRTPDHRQSGPKGRERGEGERELWVHRGFLGVLQAWSRAHTSPRSPERHKEETSPYFNNTKPPLLGHHQHAEDTLRWLSERVSTVAPWDLTALGLFSMHFEGKMPSQGLSSARYSTHQAGLLTFGGLGFVILSGQITCLVLVSFGTRSPPRTKYDSSGIQPVSVLLGESHPRCRLPLLMSYLPSPWKSHTSSESMLGTPDALHSESVTPGWATEARAMGSGHQLRDLLSGFPKSLNTPGAPATDQPRTSSCRNQVP